MENKGFTLPEFVVTIGLIGLVILIAVVIMLWGHKSFQIAGKQSVLNNEVRAEANYITKQIRNAREIVILEHWDEENLSEDYNYIYLQDGKIRKKVFVDTDKNKYPPPGLETKITELAFEKKGNKLIKFTIKAKLGEGKGAKEYRLESNVMADRLKDGFVIGGEYGTALMYRPK